MRNGPPWSSSSVAACNKAIWSNLDTQARVWMMVIRSFRLAWSHDQSTICTIIFHRRPNLPRYYQRKGGVCFSMWQVVHPTENGSHESMNNVGLGGPVDALYHSHTLLTLGTWVVVSIDYFEGGEPKISGLKTMNPLASSLWQKSFVAKYIGPRTLFIYAQPQWAFSVRNPVVPSYM